MANSALVVLCSVPDSDTGKELAGLLLANRLAACCNIIPGICSIYFWEGAVQEDSESLMVIKTSRKRYPALEKLLLREHPYDTPEIIACAIETGAHKYLQWINEATGGV